MNKGDLIKNGILTLFVHCGVYQPECSARCESGPVISCPGSGQRQKT